LVYIGQLLGVIETDVRDFKIGVENQLRESQPFQGWWIWKLLNACKSFKKVEAKVNEFNNVPRIS